MRTDQQKEKGTRVRVLLRESVNQTNGEKTMTYTIAAVCNHDGVCEDCTTYETMGDIPSVHDALDEAWSARDELEDTKDEYGLEQLEYLVFDEGFEIDRAGNRL